MTRELCTVCRSPKVVGKGCATCRDRLDRLKALAAARPRAPREKEPRRVKA